MMSPEQQQQQQQDASSSSAPSGQQYFQLIGYPGGPGAYPQAVAVPNPTDILLQHHRHQQQQSSAFSPTTIPPGPTPALWYTYDPTTQRPMIAGSHPNTTPTFMVAPGGYPPPLLPGRQQHPHLPGQLLEAPQVHSLIPQMTLSSPFHPVVPTNSHPSVGFVPQALPPSQSTQQGILPPLSSLSVLPLLMTSCFLFCFCFCLCFCFCFCFVFAFAFVCLFCLFVFCFVLFCCFIPYCLQIPRPSRPSCRLTLPPLRPSSPPRRVSPRSSNYLKVSGGSIIPLASASPQPNTMNSTEYLQDHPLKKGRRGHLSHRPRYRPIRLLLRRCSPVLCPDTSPPPFPPWHRLPARRREHTTALIRLVVRPFTGASTSRGTFASTRERSRLSAISAGAPSAASTTSNNTSKPTSARNIARPRFLLGPSPRTRRIRPRRPAPRCPVPSSPGSHPCSPSTHPLHPPPPNSSRMTGPG